MAFIREGDGIIISEIKEGDRIRGQDQAQAMTRLSFSDIKGGVLRT